MHFIPQTTGVNAYVATIEGYDAHRQGQSVIVRFTNANTGASTLNINGLGAVPIHRDTASTPMDREITASSMHVLIFDGQRFNLVTQSGRLNVQQLLSLITGYTVGANAPLAATDSLRGALGKIQGQINERIALQSPITSFTIGVNAPLAATDSLIGAPGKLQTQIFTIVETPRVSVQVGGRPYGFFGNNTFNITSVNINRSVIVPSIGVQYFLSNGSMTRGVSTSNTFTSNTQLILGFSTAWFHAGVVNVSSISGGVSFTVVESF